MQKKRKETTIDYWTVLKKRLHLLLIGIIPLIITGIGVNMMTKAASKPFMTDADLTLHFNGMIIAILGIISLITVYVISGIRTYKKWDVTKKQKAYFKKQKHPVGYGIIFFVLIILFIAKVYLSGIEGYRHLTNIFDWAIYAAVIWSIYVFLKNKMGKPKKTRPRKTHKYE